MGFISNILGRKRREPRPARCKHASLSARWELPDDEGDETLADHFVCDGCNESFSRVATVHLRAAAEERELLAAGAPAPRGIGPEPVSTWQLPPKL